MTSAHQTETSNTTRSAKVRTADRSWAGGSWIRGAKRWAIYARDNVQCVYCGAGYTGPASLTLDHVTCRIAGGTNHESNLVTACHTCNSTRSDLTLDAFARRSGLDAGSLRVKIATQTAKALDKAQGQALYAAAKAQNKAAKAA